MTTRDDFEAAWADAYPLHQEPFRRSGFDTGQYAATRVNDGWKMYMAAHEKAEAAAEALMVDAERWREFIKGEPESLVHCIGAYPIPPRFVPSLEQVVGDRTITMEMGEVVYSLFAWVRTKEIQSVQDSIDASIAAARAPDNDSGDPQ